MKYARWWLVLIPLGLLLAWCLPLLADTALNAETMKAALRTTTIEEQGFVERVVQKAREGVLPPALVDTTFDWARKKPKHKFQYFKKALVTRAAEMGVTL